MYVRSTLNAREGSEQPAELAKPTTTLPERAGVQAVGKNPPSLGQLHSRVPVPLRTSKALSQAAMDASNSRCVFAGSERLVVKPVGGLV
ncbi:hypothetical protein OV208_02905 [Corallococcus sp. bb12-1]|uniref:hypothetical protein n=1 Tax=Corallococcus sp. bb12-1 TaxID=2996784 RepID=UPI0022714A78|nr:hypothetical protein [Corallococcus sp. bb12-1]MCY1040257.1 hypothetical protein [Corallococcus sp. bb12-1]